MLKRLLRRSTAGLLGLMLALPAQAEWVEATGTALLANQDRVSARRAALRDAIRQASMQVSADVSSMQQMTDGAISTDNLRVHSQGRVRDVSIVQEAVRGGVLYLTVRADVSERNPCSGESTGYQRSLGVTGFLLQYPEQATRGGLHQIGAGLALSLTRQLNEDGNIRALSASQMRLYQSIANIPTSVTERGSLTTAITAATDLGVQYVVSGVIRDMGMVNPELASERSFFQAIYERFKYKEQRYARRFDLEVFVHDGFSGALMLRKRYQTIGIWNREQNTPVGYGTAAFWKTDYGDKLARVLQQLETDLAATINCQPFMARITRTDERTLYFDAGASAGIRPGDTLSVYRVSTFYDASQTPNTELESVDLDVAVEKVQPYFSKGKLPVLPEKVNIQQGDVVIAW